MLLEWQADGGKVQIDPMARGRASIRDYEQLRSKVEGPI
jgi:hypothetical protein